MGARPVDKAYLYTEGGDKRVGMVVLASKTLGRLGVLARSEEISDRAAAFLGIYRPNPVAILSSEPKWKLAPGVKLLENRESGAYLWKRKDPEDEVAVETRVPGWRLKIEHAGNLVARGREPDISYLPAWAKLAWGGKGIPNEPFIALAQVIQFDKAAGFVIADRDERLFAIACWAPVSVYPEYESVFEKVLSGFRIYARESPVRKARQARPRPAVK